MSSRLACKSRNVFSTLIHWLVVIEREHTEIPMNQLSFRRHGAKALVSLLLLSTVSQPERVWAQTAKDAE